MDKKNSKDPISDFLGVEPIETFTKENSVSVRDEGFSVEKKNVSQKFDTDYEKVETYVNEALEVGSTALQDMLIIAQSQESGKDYEVISKLIRAISDAAKTLANVSKNQYEKGISELSGSEEQKNSSGPVTNNNLFVGTTDELKEILDKIRDEK